MTSLEKIYLLLDRNFCKSFLDYKAGYLRSTKKVDICIKRDRAKRRNRAEEHDVNYKSLIF